MASLPAQAGTVRLDDVVTVAGGRVVLGEPGEERTTGLPPFAIGRHPLTNAQLRDFAWSTGHPLPGAVAARAAADVLADHPATGLTFDDARAVCAWASAVLGRPRADVRGRGRCPRVLDTGRLCVVPVALRGQLGDRQAGISPQVAQSSRHAFACSLSR